MRIEPDGSVLPDNPFPNSPVYSYGHRNVQGLAWDEDGQLYASEFGQNRYDEVNRSQAGSNYGWPEVEGTGGEPNYIDPITTFATSEASPSGATFLENGAIPNGRAISLRRRSRASVSGASGSTAATTSPRRSRSFRTNTAACDRSSRPPMAPCGS